MTKASARKEDRRALVLFFVLTITFCAVPYVPMLTGGGFDALGGYAVPLLMWSPGLAGIVTSLVMYRSLAPLGLAGNQQALYWMHDEAPGYPSHDFVDEDQQHAEFWQRELGQPVSGDGVWQTIVPGELGLCDGDGIWGCDRVGH